MIVTCKIARKNNKTAREEELPAYLACWQASPPFPVVHTPRNNTLTLISAAKTDGCSQTELRSTRRKIKRKKNILDDIKCVLGEVQACVRGRFSLPTPPFFLLLAGLMWAFHCLAQGGKKGPWWKHSLWNFLSRFIPRWQTEDAWKAADSVFLVTHTHTRNSQSVILAKLLFTWNEMNYCLWSIYRQRTLAIHFLGSYFL